MADDTPSGAADMAEDAVSEREHAPARLVLGSLFDDSDSEQDSINPPQPTPTLQCAPACKDPEHHPASNPPSQSNLGTPDPSSSSPSRSVPSLHNGLIFAETACPHAPSPQNDDLDQPSPITNDDTSPPPGDPSDSAHLPSSSSTSERPSKRQSAHKAEAMRRETQRLVRSQRLSIESGTVRKSFSEFLSSKIQSLKLKQASEASEPSVEQKQHQEQSRNQLTVPVEPNPETGLIELSDSDDERNALLAAPAEQSNPVFTNPLEFKQHLQYKIAKQAQQRRTKSNHQATLAIAEHGPAPSILDQVDVRLIQEKFDGEEGSAVPVTWDSEEEDHDFDPDRESGGSDSDLESDHEPQNIDAEFKMPDRVITKQECPHFPVDDELDEVAPVAPRKRKRMIQDDIDSDQGDLDDSQRALAPSPTSPRKVVESITISPTPKSPELSLSLEPSQPPLSPQPTPIGFTQLFQATAPMATQAPSQQIMDSLRQLPAPNEFALPIDTQELMMTAEIMQSQELSMDSHHAPHDDALDSTPPGDENLSPGPTLDLTASESPIQELGSKPSAFNIMMGSVGRRLVTRGEVEKTREQARGMLETEAAESEDEFMGAGGVDGEDLGDEEEQLRALEAEMLGTVNADELAADDVRQLVMQQRQQEDEAVTKRLEQDLLMGGGLAMGRRARMDMLGKGYGLEDLDDGDDGHHGSRTGNKQGHRKKRVKLAEGLASLSENPTTAPFARAFEDTGMDDDEDGDFATDEPATIVKLDTVEDAAFLARAPPKLEVMSSPHGRLSAPASSAPASPLRPLSETSTVLANTGDAAQEASKPLRPRGTFLGRNFQKRSIDTLDVGLRAIKGTLSMDGPQSAAAATRSKNPGLPKTARSSTTEGSSRLVSMLSKLG